jgi:hypothetical protein
MSEQRQWRIYYGDGSRFTSEDGSAFDAPRTNVQLIAQQDDSMGWELLSESDYYYFEPDTRGWYVADLFTVWDVLVRAKQPLIAFGRMLNTEEFRQIVLRVLDELPTPKTAWRRGEPSWVRGR